MTRLTFIALVSLIHISLFAQKTVSDSMYAQISTWKQSEQSRERDSLIITTFFDLIPHLHPLSKGNWRDSLTAYAHKFRLPFGYLLCDIAKGEKLAQEGNLLEGTKLILKASGSLTHSGHFAQASFGYLRLGAITQYMNKQENSDTKSLQYYQHALKLAQKSNNPGAETLANLYLAALYLDKNSYQKALYFNRIASRIISNDRIGSSSQHAASVYHQLGLINLQLSNVKAAKANFSKALNLIRSPGKLAYLQYISHKSLADFYLKDRKLKSAIIEADSALTALDYWQSSTPLSDAEKYRGDVYEVKYQTFKKLFQYDSALVYLEKFRRQNELNIRAELDKQLNELHIEYNTHQNKLKIANLTNEKLQQQNERRKQSLYLGGIILILIATLAVILFRSLRLKQQNTRIQLSLSQTQNNLVKQIIHTQNAERDRIARDLHDDLGGIIATLASKISHAISFTDHPVLKKELEAAVRISSQAAGRVRQIAHNLMPPEFEKAGLVESLREFILAIEHPKIQYSVFGTEKRMPSEREINIYRLLNELLLNIRKHSGANKATVQLFFHPELLSVVIEDNGDRSATENSSQQRGLGSTSMQARKEFLNAKIILDTTPDGNSVILEIPYSGS